ncbi:Fc.00g002890.m01.CDS01 [Cosmosporella sp. VM-42]
MSRQIEQALLSMMPTYGSDLPPQLVELAGSLLAQSRHRANIPNQEEVARLYACANLACDRLKITLDLPPIEPRPPVPPRIYKRLYNHLNTAIPAHAPGSAPGSARRTPRSTRQRDVGNSPASGSKPLPSRATPTKERSLAQWRTPSKNDPGTPSKSTGKRAAPTSSDGLHPWIQPCIRFLCQEKDQKHLAPTILAGMETVVLPGGRKTEDDWVLQNLTGLIAAIYFFVTARVRALASGAAVEREDYVPQRKEILALLTRARKEANIGGLDEENAWDGWTNLKSKEFDGAVAQLYERDWIKGDWYQGITDIVKLTQRGDFNDVDMLDDEESIPKTQVKRADTMFQEKYDYLSDAKRADYKAWKEAITNKIAQLTPATAAMEVDT